MGLIDKVKKPLENYISFEDLICQLSQTNNEPLYSVVSYLIHFDIKSVGHYYIFADYKITPENAPWRIEGYLEEIQKILFMHNEEWIYEGAKSFEWLSDEFTRSKLLAHIRICPYYFFKKTELLLFPPLMEDELISFKNIDIPNTPLNDALKQDYLKSLGTNHIDKASHASDEELSEQLEKSSNELKEAQAKIADLENQLAQAKAGLADKPTDDLKDVPHQSYRTVDRVMYAMAKLAKRDNTEPYSQNNPSLNAAITTILQNDGLTLEYQAVGKWLSRINDIKPLK